MNTPNQIHENSDRQEEADSVLQHIEDDHQRAMVPIRRRLAEQGRSLKRWALAALFVTILLGGSIWRDHHLNQQVASSTSVGHLLDLRPVHQPEGIWPVVLVVQASTRFFSLLEPLNLALGSGLLREERKSGRQYLCDMQRTQCAEIARSSRP
jgi:predicted neuraminidase